jgi:hypothetical protein
MTQWFRFYGDAINDPKILKLPEATRWRWVAVLAAASKCQGAIPPADDLALMLRINMQQTLELITTLERAKLIDKTETGYTPHNWNGRQYKSDVSTDRVQKHRNKKRNVSETFHDVSAGVAATVTVTPPEQRQSRADTEQTRSDQKASREVALVVEDGWPADYRIQFWTKYPNKTGKLKALAKLDRARSKGIQWLDIMIGLERYIRDKPIDRQWMNPEVFINGERWNDQIATVSSTNGKAKTGGSIIDALREQAEFFDRQADAERQALDDNEAGSLDVLGLPDE